MRLYLLVTALLISNHCLGQGDTLTVEQQRLSFIQGQWTVDGSEWTYIEICDWIQGNHLECKASSKEDDTDSSVSYFTYSLEDSAYIYYGLYGNGNSRTLRGQWIGDRFIFEGQRQASDKLTRWRVTMKPDNGRIDFLEERSVDNQEWTEIARFQYKPVIDQRN